MYTATAFGLAWHSEIPLPQFAPWPDGTPDVWVRLVREPSLRGGENAWGRVTHFVDGLRFRADDTAIFDIFSPDRIEVSPGPGWRGEMPAHFFGTIAAAVVALRGGVPVHGTALELDGRTVLLCGRSGAGKSTLAAHLVSLGARLISDDLSVLTPGDLPLLRPGRPGMRLHTDTAAWLAAQGCVGEIAPSKDCKVIVRPAHASVRESLPLDRIVLLDRSDDALPLPLAEAAFCAQMFRPRFMRLLPGQVRRLAVLRETARRIGMVRVLDLSEHNADVAAERAGRIRQLMQ